MAFKKYIAAAAAATMVATPVMAAPINPAASLSLDTAPRASSHTKHNSELAGGGLIIALIAAAGVVAGIVVVATNNKSTSP